MKLKINKACDLNSISVFPPQSRRLSTIPTGQSSQLRSQQSFSQGISSQHGMFSQLSQSSLDEAVNDQRFNSQERETSVKKTSCFPQINYRREENQRPISRSSSNIICKWNPTSVADNKCQLNDELEHRIGMIETSLNKYGMILNSVQSDVMQLNKGTKEIMLEMEGIGQKLIVLNSSLQQLTKAQEDTKFSLEGRLKSINDQQSNNETCQDKLQQIFLVLSALPQQIEASLQKLKIDLCRPLIKEIQAVACRQKTCNYSSPSIMMFAAEVTGCHSTPQWKSQTVKNPVMPAKASLPPASRQKVEMGAWNTIKAEKIALTQKASHKERLGVFSVQEILQEKQCRVAIESDEEIEGGFSCLMNQKETGIGKSIIDEAMEESDRILKRARRRKRKHCNTIIID